MLIYGKRGLTCKYLLTVLLHFILSGTYFTDDRLEQPFFVKKNHADADVLALQIMPGITSEDGYITEIMYAEELMQVDQYSAIHIYAKNELLTSIQEIEKIF